MDNVSTNSPTLPIPLKALVAPGRHSDGPTLYMICRSPDEAGCDIHEQMPDGSCVVWPGPPPKGIQQAEASIYDWARQQTGD